MSKCVKCSRHGLFLFVNIHTGLCSECQKKLQEKTVEIPQSPVTERSIEIPTVYIGNCTKSRLIEKFEDIKLKCPESLPDFSKIDCCDNVDFVVQDGVVSAKCFNETLGFVIGEHLVSEISKSLEQKRPIFSQILGYDDKTGEIHIVIAFYKIINYDYDQYTEDRDTSLEFETVGYY